MTINNLFQEAQEQTGSIDPEVLTDYVVKALLVGSRDVMEEVLPAVIHHSAVRFLGHVRAGRRAITTVGTSKWKSASVEYKSFLSRPECVGGKWKALGDCTITDVQTLAYERTGQAEELFAKAQQYDALAKKMLQRQVTKVGQLIEDEVITIFEGAA